MKRLLYIPLVLVWLLSCKKETADDPMQFGIALKSIAGPWHSIEVERFSLDNKSTWEPIPANQTDTLIFRADGVVLNTDGRPRCCAPGTLIINGQLLDVKPQTALPSNPECELLNCITCPSWEISWNDDQLIVGSCNSARTRFVR